MPMLKIGAVLTFAHISWVKVSLVDEHKVNSKKSILYITEKEMRILSSR